MKLIRDTWLVFQRYFSIFIHNPAWVAVGVVQPALYLFLFAPLLKEIVHAHIAGFPQGGAYNVFVPGLLVQLGIFGASGVGFNLISELREGVIERLRVTPVSRLALLLGRALRDTFTLLVQSLILLLLGIPFGLSIGVVGIVVVLALVAFIGILFSSISYWLALILKDENSFAPVIFTAALPLLLLSGVLLPMTIAPQWLQVVSTLNPLSHAVTAARSIALGNIANGNVGIGFLIVAVLAVLAVMGAARAFGRAIA